MTKEYVTRTYRELHQGENLVYFRVNYKQTDLDIGIASSAYTPALEDKVLRQVMRRRGELEAYIEKHSEFLRSLMPVPLMPGAPEIARKMAVAASVAGVGPMAAVAGTLAEYIGQWLSRTSAEVIVENGGDLYINTAVERRVAIAAGASPLSQRVAIKVDPAESPLGICTSSGTVGPSLSLGRADAAIVKAPSAALADAVATALGNRVQNQDDAEAAVRWAQGIRGVTGAMVIKGERLAVWGKMEIIALD